jgi:hypothetical protein
MLLHSTVDRLVSNSVALLTVAGVWPSLSENEKKYGEETD